MPAAKAAADDPNAEVLDFVRGTRLKIAGLTTFKKGTEVALTGLEANKHLNGRIGTVAGWDDSRKRWVVDLGDGVGKKLFFEANIEDAPDEPPPLEDAEVGLLATLPPAAPTEQGDDSGDEVVELFVGAMVTITGLGAKNDDLNGKVGSIVEHNDEKDRWIVQLEEGLGKKMFRDKNLVAVGLKKKSNRGAGQAASSTDPDMEAAFQGRLPPERPADEDAGPQRLKPGSQVLVGGLPGPLARLNGQIGVCERCEFMTGCWSVFFGDRTETLRPEYLTLQPATLRIGAYVKLEGLQNAKHLNGRLGICGKIDPETLRWEVHLENGESKSLKGENLVPQDSYTPQRSGEGNPKVAATFEEALQSGEISWLDA